MKVSEYLQAGNEAMAQRIIASRNERALWKPLDHNYARIPEIYKIYCDLYPKPKKPEENAIHRRVFVVIITRIYDPRALFGNKLDGKTREQLAKVFGCSRSNISHLFRHVAWQAQNVRSFREKVDECFEEMEKVLSLRT